MNPISSPQPIFEERPSENHPQMAEIPSYPVEQSPVSPEQAYIPAQQQTQEQYDYTVTQEQHNVPAVVERQPDAIRPSLIVEPTHSQENAPVLPNAEGENAFQNPELGQATFPGGVTSGQVASRVGGYAVNSAMVNDPHSGLLQQTAQSGDPTQATTWQTNILMKILHAFWKMLGKG